MLPARARRLPIVRRRDEAKHGECRTKRVTLKVYDAMGRAMESGEPYPDAAGPAAGGSRGWHIRRDTEGMDRRQHAHVARRSRFCYSASESGMKKQRPS